jgi:hypothetical protein
MNINDINTIEQLKQILTGSQTIAFLIASSAVECFRGILMIRRLNNYEKNTQNYSKPLMNEI